MLEKNILGINPIRFKKIEYYGSSGPKWATIDYYISKLVTQNILYSTYYKERSIDEIASLLGSQANFIEEEVDFLEKEGFIDKVADDKFLTNILLHDLSKEIYIEREKIFTQYAKIICEKYVPLLMDNGQWIMENEHYPLSIIHCPLSKIYTPQNDLNFLLWSIITFAYENKFDEARLTKTFLKHYVKRKDGSENYIVAYLQNDLDFKHNVENLKKYGSFRMTCEFKERYPFFTWLCNSLYDCRKNDWFRNLRPFFLCLYDFMAGRIANNQENISKFEGMFEHGLLVQTESDSINASLRNDLNQTYVNMVTTLFTKDELLNILPDIPEEFYDLNDELAEKLFNLCKSQYPERMHDTCKAYFQTSISNTDMLNKVLEQLLLNGTLKPITEIQKKTVNMILFCDVFP